MIRAWWLLTLAPLVAGGCVHHGDTTELLPNNTFAPIATQNKATGVPKDAPPATQEAAARVNRVGQKLVEANPQAGLRPVFHTVGVAEPEVFHRGTSEVFVTEGLIRQCGGDGQLAAVLALEMGKMVSQREAMTGPTTRRPERPPPAEVCIGGDSRPADATRLAELSQYEAPGARAGRSAPLPPPDPSVLARGYLQKASYSASDLDSVQQLLRTAQGNVTVEKQLKSAATLGKPTVR